MAKQIILRIPTDGSYGQTIRTIQEDINIEIAKKLNKESQRIAKRIDRRIQKLAKQKLRESPEYQSLTSSEAGSLKAHFGLSDRLANEVVSELPDVVAETLLVTIQPFVGQFASIKGTWKIEMVPADYGSWLLRERWASYESIPAKKKGVADPLVDWLRWLLYYGDTLVLRDYEIELGSYPKNISRTGLAVMSLQKPGAGWRVPPEYSGTLKNNWLTRTFRDNQDFLDKVEIEVGLAFNELLK